MDAFTAYHFGWTVDQTDDTDYDRLLCILQALPRVLGQEEVGSEEERQTERAQSSYLARIQAKG